MNTVKLPHQRRRQFDHMAARVPPRRSEYIASAGIIIAAIIWVTVVVWLILHY